MTRLSLLLMLVACVFMATGIVIAQEDEPVETPV